MLTTEENLTELENWFKECSGDPLRPKLLCKLAFIEFCGWIEEWMDEAIREIDAHTTNDSDWVENNLIKKTNGFDYSKHFRPMTCNLLGEHRVRLAEHRFSTNTPYVLDSLKSTLGQYWKKRCKFAHQDMVAHQQAQIQFDAPSWTKNQFRVTEKQLEALKLELLQGL